MDINKQWNFGDTALIQAARRGHYDAACVVLEYGKAEVNTRNIDGHTAFSEAVSNGDVDLAKLLLGHGAEIDIRGYDKSGRVTELVPATRRRGEELVRILVSLGADVNVTDVMGWTPLHWTVRGRHEAILRILLQRDDLELNPRDDQTGQTPLELARELGYHELLRLLQDRANRLANNQFKIVHPPTEPLRVGSKL